MSMCMCFYESICPSLRVCVCVAKYKSVCVCVCVSVYVYVSPSTRAYVIRKSVDTHLSEATPIEAPIFSHFLLIFTFIFSLIVSNVFEFIFILIVCV